MSPIVLDIIGAARRFLRSESGSSTLEFVLVFPAVMYLMIMAFEMGVMQIRYVLLERAVDVTVRQVQIGRITDPTHVQLKEEICSRYGIMKNCLADLQVEMIIEDLYNWSGGLTGEVKCIDREEEVQPATRYSLGDNNELMILQVCALYDPILIINGFGWRIVDDTKGTFGLATKAAFVMEPSNNGT